MQGQAQRGEWTQAHTCVMGTGSGRVWLENPCGACGFDNLKGRRERWATGTKDTSSEFLSQAQTTGRSSWRGAGPAPGLVNSSSVSLPVDMARPSLIHTGLDCHQPPWGQSLLWGKIPGLGTQPSAKHQPCGFVGPMKVSAPTIC